jgi:hypothetical protein
MMDICVDTSRDYFYIIQETYCLYVLTKVCENMPKKITESYDCIMKGAEIAAFHHVEKLYLRECD